MGWVKDGRRQQNSVQPMRPPLPVGSFASSAGKTDSEVESQPNDVFIVVMGPTGSGKTSYVNLCSGTTSLEVGHGLRSCTEFIAEVAFEHRGFRVHLIDTPGFDDTSGSDSEVLMEIAYYLATTYNSHMRIDGLIYITPITSVRFTGSAHKNLRMFTRLVGEESLSKVVLATSMWDQMETSQQAEAREAELIKSFWKVLIDEGSTVYRLDGHRDSAIRVVDALLPSDDNEGEILQIQRELVDESRTLNQTEAGKALVDDFRSLQERIQQDLEAIDSKVKNTTTEKDDEFAHHVSFMEDRLKLRMSQIEDERNRLDIDFRRLKEDREEKLTLLTRQIETETKEHTRHLEKLNSEIARKLTRIGNESETQKESAVTLSNTEQPKVKQLEEELAVCRRELAEKDARMENLKNFMLFQIKGGVTGPPPPYSHTATPISISTTDFKNNNLIEDSDTSQSPSEDETDRAIGLKSTVARKQNRYFESAPAKPVWRDAAGKVTPGHDRANRRPASVDRMHTRRELYQHSLHSLADYTSTSLSHERIDLLAALAQKLAKDVIIKAGIHNTKGLSEQSARASKSLPYSRFLLCRDIAIIVYANCRRLQSTDLAGECFNLLVLLPSSPNRPSMVTLKRVFIKEVQTLLEALNDCIHWIYHIQGPLDAHGSQKVNDSFSKVQKLFQETLVVVGLDNIWKRLTEEQLHEASKLLLEEIWEGKGDISATISLEWQCILQVLDLGILAYAGAHISDVYENVLASEAQNFLIPEPSLALPGTPEFPRAIKRIKCRRLRLKCLSSFLEDREVWVFDDTMGLNFPPLYLVTDIDSFADVWGPVWRVADLRRPGRIAKYNVGGGSILPWRFDENVHPQLKANERLCHWKSNAQYIRSNETCSSNLSSSSSTASSETEEIPADEPVPESFTGSETLVIGADQSPRLQWKPCGCPVDSLKRHLKNAGRLDEIIASKSFRYVEAQQNNLVLGSHGLQVGFSRTLKDKREEPLKKSLLDRWENEADSRDPRRLENLWGVAVSLCTMNAQRVRLVDLLAEESVLALLRYFPWSDLNYNGTASKIRKRYLKAVHSHDPLALGNLWDHKPSWREELGNAILVCLRILFRTGYDKDREEFHMLWLPPRCRTPRRVTLKPTDQSWVRFLKDTTDSVTVAVVVEDSLGSQTRCSGNKPRWFKAPSILETAICINSTLEPTPKLVRTRGCQDENHYITRRDFGDWQSTWDVSALGPGEHLWMNSQTRVRTIGPLSKWHLLVEIDTVKRLILREMVGMKPSERIGHREYTDEELDSDDVRPIPVHITS